MRKHFKKALLNIIKHGDTDIFPFPFERYLFEEKNKESLDILESIHGDLDNAISESPPLTLVKLLVTMVLDKPQWLSHFGMLIF
jgi:hypothetical protein